jgi:hypothetical protein
MQKKKWMSELQELKAIFQDCLPCGEETQKVEEYFNSLEKVIFTNDYKVNPNPLRREEFKCSDPDIQYSYISDAIFKERSSKQQLRAHRQIMDDQPDVHKGEISQLGSSFTPDFEPIPECAEGGSTEDDWREYSRNTSRKLSSWTDSKIPE